MKFGKRLKKQVEGSLPEWRDKFLAYKRLKKLVVSATGSPPRHAAEAEAAFLRMLDGEVDRINAFFLEQEEEFVIRQRELQETVKKVDSGGRRAAEWEAAGVRKEMVDLHGEMVLLLNYSAINYTGLAKILKKYDKRTGRLLRLPFIEMVLKQPFFTTELISKLVRDCEATMEATFAATGSGNRVNIREGCIYAGMVPAEGIFQNTVAALVTMKELRSGSSTYGQFSLPPMMMVAPALPENNLLQCIQVADPIPI